MREWETKKGKRGERRGEGDSREEIERLGERERSEREGERRNQSKTQKETD